MPFTVTITPSELDGLSVMLVEDQQSYSIHASYIPYDSLSELTASLLVMLQSSTISYSRWNTEPIEYEIVLEATEQGRAVGVWWYPDRRRHREEGRLVFKCQAEPEAIARAFWRTLRRLESDTGFVARWRHPFPHRDVQRLGELLMREQQ